MRYTATIEIPESRSLRPAVLREISRQLAMVAEHLSSCADEYSIYNGNLPDGAINYEDPDTRAVVTAASDQRHQKIVAAVQRCQAEGLRASLGPRDLIRSDFTKTLRIMLKASCDPGRRDNGGEYDYWLAVIVDGDKVVARECCSCDFWQPEEHYEPVGDAAEFDSIVAAVAAAVPFKDHFAVAAA